jgi:phage terminase large subunit-like protein
MGLRGIGATPLSKRKQALADEMPQFPQEMPWESKSLSRWEKVIVFCEQLTVTSGPDAGKKLQLRPWQKRFIRAVYSENTKNIRPVRTAVLSMGRKNGKTQLAAALALAHLSGPEFEQRGEVYSCANDRFQASKIFNEMVALISHHPWLATRCNIIRFKKDIEDLTNGSIYSALSAEAKTKMGLSPSFVVYDELGQTSGRELYDAMDSAMGGRKEPLMLVISTQAADDFAPMSALIDYGLRINAGEIKDPAFHLTFYSAPPDTDPWSLHAWKLANPALDDFRSLDDVRRLAIQAQRMPARENTFRNLILNQRVAAESRFMTPEIWNACDGEVDIPQGARVYAGLDLGGPLDLSALVLSWEDADGFYHLKPYVWVPGNLKDRTEQERVPYETWAKKGFIIPSGITTDPAVVAHKIAEVNGGNHIIGLAYDRWRIADLRRELDKIGCSVPLIEHGQGFRDMARAVDIVERLISEKKIKHGGHPVLLMAATNAVVVRDPAGNRKLDKSKSINRIDALVAAAMALSAAGMRKEIPFDPEALIA